LKGRKEKATRDLQSIRTRLADANSKLAQARSKATPAKGGPAKAIAMLEILEHNVANHIPNRGVPMIKPQSIDALANAISGTAPGVFNVASKTISSLIEITGSGDDDEGIYCPENFCQRRKKNVMQISMDHAFSLNASRKRPKIFVCQPYGQQQKVRRNVLHC